MRERRLRPPARWIAARSFALIEVIKVGPTIGEYRAKVKTTAPVEIMRDRLPALPRIDSDHFTRRHGP